MDLTKIKDVILKNEYELPLVINRNDIYAKLNNIYQMYISDLTPLLDEYYTEQLKQTCDTIIHAIILYFNGYPEKAYKRFCESIPYTIETNSKFYEKSLETSNYVETLNLYRIREPNNDQTTYSRQDIFHVPFSKRREISTSRYSIAGYPCLYLGTSIDLCRKETLSSANQPGIASAFRLKRNYLENGVRIRVLDLGLKPSDIVTLVDEQDTSGEATILQYIMMYPIIAGCSLKIKNKTPFVPEYILPQLLMQWLRTKQSNDEMSGIRYFTSRSKSPIIKGYNYVFPVAQKIELDLATTEYCQTLAKCFSFTNPISVNDFTNPSEVEDRLSRETFGELLT